MTELRTKTEIKECGAIGLAAAAITAVAGAPVAGRAARQAIDFLTGGGKKDV